VRYFIMLNYPGLGPRPLVDDGEADDPKTVLFASEKEAEAAADRCRAAVAWGFEVYPWPY
jgi:hypothetical protein